MSLYMRSRRPCSVTNAIASRATSLRFQAEVQPAAAVPRAATRGTIAAPASRPWRRRRRGGRRPERGPSPPGPRRRRLSAEATIGPDSNANSARKRWRRAPARPSTTTEATGASGGRATGGEHDARRDEGGRAWWPPPRSQPRWRHLLPVALLGLLGARRIRFVAEFALLAGPIVACALTDAAGRLARRGHCAAPRPRPRRDRRRRRPAGGRRAGAARRRRPARRPLPRPRLEPTLVPPRRSSSPTTTACATACTTTWRSART